MARDTSTSPRQPRHRKFRRSPRAGAGSKAVCQFIIGVFSCEEKREKAKRSLWGSPNINLRGVGLGERRPDYLSYELLPFWGTDYPQLAKSFRKYLCKAMDSIFIEFIAQV